MIFEDFYRSTVLWLEKKLGSRNWHLTLTLWCAVVSIFLAFPPYTLLHEYIYQHSGVLDAWTFVHNQADNLLHPKDIGYGVFSRRNAVIYRWTLPFLSFITHHNIILIIFLQAMLGIANIYLIARYVYARSNDKVATCLFTLAFSNIFIGSWAFVDIHGYGDTFAYFFLLTAMLARRPFAVFIALILAFFTDERAVVAGGYVLLWWMLIYAYESGDFSFRNLIKNTFLGRSLIVWLCWILYFGLRYYVGNTYFPDHRYTYDWAPIMLKDLNRYGLGSSLWTVFEGMWLIIGAGTLALFLTRRYAPLFMLSVGFIVLISTAVYVQDVDRALSYGFPFLLMSLFILSKEASLSAMRSILFVTAFVCVVHPLLFTMGFNRIIWVEPFPIRLAMGADRIFGLNLFN
jgi:hypothetical protein